MTMNDSDRLIEKSQKPLPSEAVKIRLDAGAELSVKAPDATMLEKLSDALSTRSKPGMVRKIKGEVTAISLQHYQNVNKSSNEVLASKHGTMAKPNHWTGSSSALGSQADIVITPNALIKRGLHLTLLSKPSKSFIHKANRGFEALRLNGLLKQKCKKGSRKHYPIRSGKSFVNPHGRHYHSLSDVWSFNDAIKTMASY